MVERNEVSLHEVLVFYALQRAPAQWLTNRDIADILKPKVAARTVRAHVLKLVKLGLVDQAEVFPAHRYRLAAKGDKRNRGYLQRLTDAAAIFGVTP